MGCSTKGRMLQNDNELVRMTKEIIYDKENVNAVPAIDTIIHVSMQHTPLQLMYLHQDDRLFSCLQQKPTKSSLLQWEGGCVFYKNPNKQA